MNALVRLSALLLLVAACDTPTVPGHSTSDVYEFRLQTTPLSVLRWPSGSTISVFVAGGSGTRADVLGSALQHGARTWNEQARYGEYRLRRAATIADADVVLRWSDDLAPVETAGCEPVVTRAVTTFCLVPGAAGGPRLQTFPLLPPHDPAAGRVRMLVTVLGSHSTQPERVNRLVAHELGHVLGLAQHSPDPRDLMYGGELTQSEPSRRDAATVHVLYHTRPDIVP